MDFQLVFMAKHSQLQTGPALAQGLQNIFIRAKQLQPALAGLAADVHYHNFRVGALWVDETEAFQWNALSSNGQVTKVAQRHRCATVVESDCVQLLPASWSGSPDSVCASTCWDLDLTEKSTNVVNFAKQIIKALAWIY